MIFSKEKSPVYNVKLSSVGPGKITGLDATHHPTNMDLAMKLHYLRGVYYFNNQAFQTLTLLNIKETIFNWLNHAYLTCGRFRRSEETGRPYIKCNDCGVRFVEAQCEKSLDEWLDGLANADGLGSHSHDHLHKLLIPNPVIGPELPFSPLVWMQLTKFKCGGTSVGFSWAHVLGDAVAAAEYFNMWGRLISGYYPAQPFKVAQSKVVPLQYESPTIIEDHPVSFQRVEPVGDLWVFPNNYKMESFSFYVSPSQLSHLQSKMCGGKTGSEIPTFESLCAMIWQCVARIRPGSEPNVVTVCQRDEKDLKIRVTNESQIISVVKSSTSVTEASLKELALLMINRSADGERRKIESAMERDHGLSDFIIYGANLTFVDLGDAPFYEFDVKGQKPVYVHYNVDSVGDEGTVLVLPAPRDDENDNCDGRIVSMTLPENKVSAFMTELKKEWFDVA